MNGESKRIIFTATAGAGKTMLLRYLFLQTLSNNEDVLPIFLELRDLNDYPEKSIFDFVLEGIREKIDNFTKDQLRYALREGFVVLFMDGFDEIDYDKANKRAKEIITLANQYDKMSIFLTSRREESFQSWEDFNVFRLNALTKPQVHLLVQKIPYDRSVKELFEKQLSMRLYETHTDLMANALLVVMVLITLQYFSESV
jgi:predicted NACHT family NTPase